MCNLNPLPEIFLNCCRTFLSSPSHNFITFQNFPQKSFVYYSFISCLHSRSHFSTKFTKNFCIIVSAQIISNIFDVSIRNINSNRIFDHKYLSIHHYMSLLHQTNKIAMSSHPMDSYN